MHWCGVGVASASVRTRGSLRRPDVRDMSVPRRLQSMDFSLSFSFLFSPISLLTLSFPLFLSFSLSLSPLSPSPLSLSLSLSPPLGPCYSPPPCVAGRGSGTPRASCATAMSLSSGTECQATRSGRESPLHTTAIRAC